MNPTILICNIHTSKFLSDNITELVRNGTPVASFKPPFVDDYMIFLLCSIASRAREDVFITGLSTLQINAQNWPMLYLQPIAGSLTGIALGTL